MQNPSHIYRYKSASLSLTEINPTTYRLHNLRSAVLAHGHASALLQIVIDWADEQGVDIQLVVQGYGRHGILNNKQLVAFYEKYGFEKCNTVTPAHMSRTSHNKHG